MSGGIRNDAVQTLNQPEKGAGTVSRILMAMATLALLAGCNTVAGVGEDITGGARTVGRMIGG